MRLTTRKKRKKTWFEGVRVVAAVKLGAAHSRVHLSSMGRGGRAVARKEVMACLMSRRCWAASASECSFDSGSDKSRPSAWFAAMQFHPFLDWEFKDWLVTRKKQILFGAWCKDLWLQLLETLALFFTQIVIASEPELPQEVSPEMTQDEFGCQTASPDQCWDHPECVLLGLESIVC